LNVAEANTRKLQAEAQMLRSENDSLAKYENAFRASNEQVKSLRREITNLNQRRQAADSAKSDIDQIASAARLINPGSDDTSPQI
jgi:prefoldin subunit 5